MTNFDESEMIHSSAYQDVSDHATRKFLRREYARLVETSEEHSAKLDSMEEMLLEVKNTLSQFANQLGKRQFEAESRQLAPSIEMPEFDASNVSDWLSEVERFFGVGRYSDLDKLDLVAFSLEGYVLQWFSWEMSHREFHSWKEFTRRLLLKFGAASEESSENVAEILGEKGSSTEKELIPQYQVPISSLEPSLSFSSEPLDVSTSWPSAIVNNIRVQSQFGLACVKNKNNAHHVFDELFLRRHKFQQRKKLSLSPKSWMFKFKNMTLPRNWSQMDLHQVIDISKVNNPYPCFSANLGLVRKKRTFPCLRLKKQAHKSRVLYQLRRLPDPGGKKDEHSDYIFETEVDIDNAVLEEIIQGDNEASPTLIDELQIELTQGMDLHGASGHCSSDKMNQFHSPIGLVDALHSGLGENVHSLPAAQQKSSSIWHRWRRKDWDLEVQLRVRELMLSLIHHNLQRAHEIRKHYDVTKHSVVEFSVGDWVYLKLLSYRQLSVVHNVFHVSQLKAVLGDHHQVHSSVPPELLEEALWLPEAVIHVRFAAVGRRELLVQWQDHDSFENSWMFSTDFVHLYPPFQLEDKLVLRGESIDTTHQAYCRKKKRNLAVGGRVTWQSLQK